MSQDWYQQSMTALQLNGKGERTYPAGLLEHRIEYDSVVSILTVGVKQNRFGLRVLFKDSIDS
jgi:hypothetical protein